MNLVESSSSKTAVITGASGGIGDALSRELLSYDPQLNLVIVGRDASKLNQIKRLFSERVEIIISDLAVDREREQLLEALQKKPQIDFLVHSAAVVQPLKQLADISLDEWRAAQRVNVDAPLFITTSLLSKLANGRVMFLTSDSELQPVVGAGTYCVNKSALQMLWQCLKAEYQGVEQNKENKYSSNNVAFGLIAPGNVDTSMQEVIRHTDKAILPFAPILAQAYQQGQLLKPSYVAEFLRWLLYDVDAALFSQKIWNIYAELSHQAWLKQ